MKDDLISGAATTSSPDQAIAQRNSLVLVRDAVVMAIAFLGRDVGTDREKTTIPQIIKALSNADTEVRRVLASVDVAQGSVEQAKAYVDRAIASYVGDPADNQFQKGFLAALEVVRDEAFTLPSPHSDGGK